MKLIIETSNIREIALPNIARQYFDAFDWTADEHHLQFESAAPDRFQEYMAGIKNEVTTLLAKAGVTVPDSILFLLLHNFMLVLIVEEVMKGHMRQQVEHLIPDEHEREDTYAILDTLGSLIK